MTDVTSMSQMAFREFVLVMWVIGGGLLAVHVLTVWWRFNKIYDLVLKSQGVSLATELQRLHEGIKHETRVVMRRIEPLEEARDAEHKEALEVNQHLLNAIDSMRVEWTNHRETLAQQIASDVRVSIEAIARSAAREETHRILGERGL